MEKIIATNETIKDIMRSEVRRLGIDADLNHIDVSNVTDMSYMFKDSQFNGDISKWDVSNVTTMNSMFKHSIFNGDISKWDVSNVVDIDFMFSNSIFNRDISNWDVSKVDNHDMFHNCPIKEEYKPKFRGISKLQVKNNCEITYTCKEMSSTQREFFKPKESGYINCKDYTRCVYGQVLCEDCIVCRSDDAIKNVVKKVLLYKGEL